MWFERKKREEEDEKKKTEKQYVAGDTPLGRYYNKVLNKRFSQSKHSEALSYEMLRQIDEKVDLYGERTAMFEARVAKLELAAKKAGDYADALINAYTKGYNAKLGDLVPVDTTDGPVTVTLPKIDGKDNNDAILIKKMDRSENVVTVTNFEGQVIGAIRRQHSSLVMTAKSGFWDIG